jgi:hypothetical protein
MPGLHSRASRLRWLLLVMGCCLALAGCQRDQGAGPEPSPDAYATFQVAVNATNIALRGTATPLPAGAAKPAVGPTPTADTRSVDYAKGGGAISARLAAVVTNVSQLTGEYRQGAIDRAAFAGLLAERRMESAQIRDDAFKLSPPPNLEEVNGLLVGAAETAAAALARLQDAHQAADAARQVEALQQLEDAGARLRRAATLFSQRFPGAPPFSQVPERTVIIAPLTTPSSSARA